MYYVVFFIVLATATAWKLYQLSRAPRNLGLRWLTLCVVCATAAYPLGTDSARVTIDGLFSIGATKLLIDILYLGMLCTLMLFYLHSAGDVPAVRRRARWEVAGFLAVVIGIVTAAVTAPHHAVLWNSFESADMTVPQVAIFYLEIGLYMLYSISVSCRRTHRYARMSSGTAAVGLWAATAGLLGMAVSTSFRTAFVIFRSQGGAVPAWLTIASSGLLVASLPVFVLGVTWPGAQSRYAACRLWLEHRRVYRDLEPLWRLLSSTYPDTVLPEEGWRWRSNFRYARRVIECRDGLLRISPHLSFAGPVLESMAPEDLAVRLQHAAVAVRRGQAHVPPGRPLAISRHNDLTAEVKQLVALSRALRTLAAEDHVAV
ncbi:MAB_1171c family putative transporter [Streptomyces sp. MNP-20]|uniref:MAB_1171c family putative transporter n=1 Tax=Streptomyces sp. MNP-20 TaxID=2721165 RepID=UPI001552DFE2|nr:MAB_1171c family putative transporter [Streptomyces sp. MNP-20]